VPADALVCGGRVPLRVFIFFKFVFTIFIDFFNLKNKSHRVFLEKENCPSKKSSILGKEIVRRKKVQFWGKKFGEQINHRNTPHSSKH
jgi:hypothetical protein